MEDSLDETHCVDASEAYPKPILHCDVGSHSVPSQFPPLCGEGTQYFGCTTDGVLVLSNYRLYLAEDTIFNVPLGLIDQIECRDIFYLYIHCKDARSFRCTFSNNEECQRCYKDLLAAISPKKTLDGHFCFAFYSWSKEEHKDSLFSEPHQGKACGIRAEAERMGFDLVNAWRITKLNEEYKLCRSYPKDIIVPRPIHDRVLEEAATFRFSKRIPSVIWRHQQNGCVIARCSQPEVGWFGRRSPEDQDLVQAIVEACGNDPGFELKNGTREECVSLKSDLDGEDIVLLQDKVRDTGISKNSKLLIVDARSYAAAVANRAKGGGYECPEYYPNCEIQFLNLANIHTIRKSFINMRVLCATAADHQNWWSSLEYTKWLEHISGLIRAALLIVNAVDMERRSVLVHCSDGWDRSPQIIALAELMMDPYYRTRKGFQVLVEKEWLEYGHKFADRCGHSCSGDDPNERSPVFLQWLDCVHQLLNQFPCHFEFNQQYLVKLVQHTYSCLFGTFLCNTDQEREQHRVHTRTFSVWVFLNSSDHFHNYVFNHSNQVLRPSCQFRKIRFWEEVYLPTYSSTLGKSTIPPEPEIVPEEACGEGALRVKTKSCDNMSSIDHSSGRQRRSSDPNIIESASTYADGHIDQKQPNGSICNEKINASSTLVSPYSCQNCYLSDTNSNVFAEPDIKDNLSERTKSSPNELCLNSTLPLADVVIDGSTDTLVSDNGINMSEPSVDNLTEISDNCSESLSNGKLVRSTRVETTEDNEPSTASISLLDIVKNGNLVEDKLSLCESVFDAYVSNKKAIFRCGSRCYSTPHHSRTPSSGFPATPCDDHSNDSFRGCVVFPQTLDVDGLTVMRDEVHDQMHKIICNYKAKLLCCEEDLRAAQRPSPEVCNNFQGKDTNCMDILDDASSSADSACSGEPRVDNSMGSDVSWERVDCPTIAGLWIPDHAVSHCMGCDAKFWVGLWKHHCRKCGGVFCFSCSNQVMPIPTEQLFNPVRVCCFCYQVLQNPCEESVVSCDKLPKPIVTAAST